MKTILIFLIFVNVGFAQTNYYVSQAGNDSNNGTSINTAWKTIQRAFNDLPSPIPAGSIVNILSGIYKERLIAKISGASGQFITFQNYQNGEVIIHGDNMGGSALLDINSHSYLVINGLKFQYAIGNNAVGLEIQGNSSNIKILNNTFSNIDFSANPQSETFDCLSVSTTRSSNPLLLLGNSATAMQSIIVKGNVLQKCQTGCSEVVSVNGNVMNFEVTENRISDNGNIGIVIAGFYAWVFGNQLPTPPYNQARSGLVARNVVSNCKTPVQYGYSAGIYIDGAKDIVVEQNRSFNNHVGIHVGCENTNHEASGIIVRNNIIYANERHGLGVGGVAETLHGIVNNSYFLNNQLYFNNLSSGSDFGEIYFAKTTNSIIKNNIIFAYKHFFAVLMKVQYPAYYIGNVFDNNLYYSPEQAANAVIKWGDTNTFYNFEVYKQHNNGQEIHSLLADPLFVNPVLPQPELHLKANSPAIGNGESSANINLIGTVDFDGNNRLNNNLDIGAYEYYTCPNIVKIFGNITDNILVKGINIRAENVISGSNINYWGANKIEFNVGTIIPNGSIFLAKIQPCN